MHTLVAPTLDPSITKRHHLFTTLVGVVADRHKAYLKEHALPIEFCYTLELNEGKAQLKIERWVPLNLSSELYQCFAKSFK
ncbi:hypothetical protein [Hymenobacter volaticus]|uniref:Uncharacterized protein n=1 Tax=Hymenobacter volaticus TaxID=2932254 RepID=A0ABY4GBW6_9BACT|nr:hypothetical protein [Hymenobacter volaticus]UOQ68342.1 hypothetical protein MUN86_11095 [Hymenobacter volaticus]